MDHKENDKDCVEMNVTEKGREMEEEKAEKMTMMMLRRKESGEIILQVTMIGRQK